MIHKEVASIGWEYCYFVGIELFYLKSERDASVVFFCCCFFLGRFPGVEGTIVTLVKPNC